MAEVSPDQKPIGTGFHAKSTAMDVAEGHDLTGKTVVITGGYSGIGFETTRALASCGARLILPARRPDTAKEALSDIEGDLTVSAMDLSDFESVAKGAAEIAESAPIIDILINNAGVMACPLRRVNDIYEYQFATNHLGHYLLTKGLMASLQSAEIPRIVALSSTGHRLSPVRFDDPHFQKDPYDKWVAYGQAKTANSLFAVGLAQQYGKEGIAAYSVHPGGIMTPLQRHLAQEEMVALGWLNEDGSMPPQVKALFKTPEQGASTTLVAALSPALNGINGVYLEDGDIAKRATEDSMTFQHVRDHAVDQEAAEKLWKLTQDFVG